MAFEFLSNLFKKEIVIKPGKTRPVVLLVLDGWGVAPDSAGNAISQGSTPNMDRLYSLYPHGELIASGESVGLPANEVGNTEVGHLNMGAGRIVLQDLKRINKAIEDGTFFDNRAFRYAANHVSQNHSRLHLMGLVGSGNVHSSLDHLFALLEFCKRNNLREVFLHLFTDGRDAPPNEGVTVLEKIEEYLKTNGFGKIATISGRYWAMDRDRRWERTQKAYLAIVNGQGLTAASAKEAINASYAAGKTDEFIEPTVIVQNGAPLTKISDNDAVIFFNFRIDRPRQLTMAFVVKDFKKENLTWEFDPYAVKYEKKHQTKVETIASEPFARGRPLNNLFFVTMTQYQKSLPVNDVAFPPEQVDKCLAQVISEANLRQMHMSESEKERFVTYYFDGLREERLKEEETHIVASPKVATYDQKPEMSVYTLVQEFKKELARDWYWFFLVNIANPDMVAHSGNLQATIAAVGHADKAVGEIVNATLAAGGILIVTGDHGNAEELVTYPSTSYFFTTQQGVVNTDHSNNPVPIIFVAKEFEGKVKVLPRGILADIAPTILGLMRLAPPSVMSGRNLLT